jgi:glutamate-1-semialdehyde 2,1-aminomutase
MTNSQPMPVSPFVSIDDETAAQSNVDPALQSALDASIARYRARNPCSAAQAERAAAVMPGGNTRSSLWADPFPLCMAGGHGARLRDVDGHEYRDFLGEFTAGIFGHSPAPIQAAIDAAFAGGVSLSSHNLLEVELAETLQSRFPSMQRLRFCNSGTEANMMAVMAARHFTGRRKLLIFAGAYHGTGMTVSTDARQDQMPPDFLLARYNDLDEARRVARVHSGDLAGILVEPMLGAGGCVVGDPDFLFGLQALAAETGALFMLDEVQTARLALGGRQELLGLNPDLTTIGKFFGGCLAFGCFGGRLDVMQMFDPRRSDAVAHAGTFNNNILAMAAGLVATRDLLTAEALDRLNSRGEHLRETLNRLFERQGAPFRTTGIGSLMNIHPIGRAEDASAVRALLYHELLAEGIFIAQRGLIALSMPISQEDIDAFLTAVGAFIDRNGCVLRT